MNRRLPTKARLSLLGDVLKLLRQRRRTIHSLIIRPDGAIEVRLTPLPDGEQRDTELDAELARFRAQHGYE